MAVLDEFFMMQQQKEELEEKKLQIEKMYSENDARIIKWGVERYTTEYRKFIIDKACKCNYISEDIIEKLKEYDEKLNCKDVKCEYIETFAQNEVLIFDIRVDEKLSKIEWIHNLLYGGDV